MLAGDVFVTVFAKFFRQERPNQLPRFFLFLFLLFFFLESGFIIRSLPKGS